MTAESWNDLWHILVISTAHHDLVKKLSRDIIHKLISPSSGLLILFQTVSEHTYLFLRSKIVYVQAGHCWHRVCVRLSVREPRVSSGFRLSRSATVCSPWAHSLPSIFYTFCAFFISFPLLSMLSATSLLPPLHTVTHSFRAVFVERLSCVTVRGQAGAKIRPHAEISIRTV